MVNCLFLSILVAVSAFGTVECGDCVDSGFTIGGQNCAQYIAADPCNCKRTFSGLPVTTLCCASCDQADTDNCCKDRISSADPLSLNNGAKNLTSCDEVRSDYQTLCNFASMNSELGQCCETCADLGNCLNKNIIFNAVDNCTQYIARDRCNCENIFQDKVVREDCCDACKGVDTTGCDCRDKLSATNTVKYSVKYSNGTKMEYNFTSCADVVATAPQLCSSLKEDKCCSACKPVCVDNPFFRATLKNSKNGKKCKKCSCSQIRAFNKRVAKKACRKNQRKVAENCCDMCKEFKK